jgi:type I restriction enzyme S subunit
MERKNIPEIRFKGFEDEWSSQKLSVITDVRDGTHDSPKYINKGYPLVTSKNVSDGYINYDDIQYISKKDYDKINQRSKVDISDILFGMIGTIGNIALVREEPSYAIKNVALIKNLNLVDNFYLYHSLQSKYTLMQLTNNLAGGTQKFISLTNIRNLDINLTNEKEQRKIGLLFENLDKKLELEKEKHKKLEDFKKSMLEDMFPKDGENIPKLRFDGFEGEWETEHLGNVCSISNGAMNTEEAENNGKYPFFVRSEEVLRSNKYLYDEEAILTPGEGKIGEIFHYINGKYAVHQRVYRIFDFGKNLDAQFLMYEMKKNFKEHALSNSSTATAPSIRKTTLDGYKIKYPKLEEQQKIGNFFRNLDEKIQASKEKIAKIEDFKNSLMEKMFV